MKMQVCINMKIETGSIASLQVGLVMKVEIASMLNYENRNCKYA